MRSILLLIGCAAIIANGCQSPTESFDSGGSADFSIGTRDYGLRQFADGNPVDTAIKCVYSVPSKELSLDAGPLHFQLSVPPGAGTYVLDSDFVIAAVSPHIFRVDTAAPRSFSITRFDTASKVLDAYFNYKGIDVRDSSADRPSVHGWFRDVQVRVTH